MQVQLSFSRGAGEGQDLHLAWALRPARNLVVTMSNGLLVIDVDATKARNGAEVTCAEGSLPSGVTHLRVDADEAPAAVAASPDSTLLAAGTPSGRV